MDLTDGEGADVVIELRRPAAIGREQLRSLCAAAASSFSTANPWEEMLAPSRDFNRREIWAVGCWYYFMSDVPEMIALWREGLDVARMISHRFPLDQAPAAFELFDRGQTGKVLLHP